MKKIGIIGGVGWPSTIEYYRLICEASQSYHQHIDYSGPTPMPEIVIESLNMNFTVNNRGTSEPDSWAVWDNYFKQALRRLEKAGAALIVIASVTPHARFEQISAGASVPILSIYDVVGQHCNAAKLSNLLVLGTMPTMTSPAFAHNMQQFGVNAFYPATDSLKADVSGIIARLYQNQTEGAAAELAGLVNLCIPADQLKNTAVCLACTELPLAFGELSNRADFEWQGLRYINASVVHASAAFQACLS